MRRDIPQVRRPINAWLRDCPQDEPGEINPDVPEHLGLWRTLVGTGKLVSEARASSVPDGDQSRQPTADLINITVSCIKRTGRVNYRF